MSKYGSRLVLGITQKGLLAMGGDLRPWTFCIFGSLLLTGADASAGGLSVWPLQVDLRGGDAVQEINVTNPTNEKSYVQVMALDWHEAGEATRADYVDDILAVPPVFELEPKASQLVRVAARQPASDGIEQSYRLVITEVPRTAGLVPNSLAIAARMTLPIFVTPEDAAPTPIWSLVGLNTKEPELVLANQGNAHIKVKKIVLVDSVTDADAFSTEQSALVLPGEENRWPLDLEIARLKGPVTLRARTTAGPIEIQIPLSSD